MCVTATVHHYRNNNDERDDGTTADDLTRDNMMLLMSLAHARARVSQYIAFAGRACNMMMAEFVHDKCIDLLQNAAR